MFLRLKSLSSLSTSHSRLFASRRLFSSSSYPFLKELGLSEENPGAFVAGKWCGSGEVFTSINPTTNKPVAHVRGVSCSPFFEEILQLCCCC
jgi:hypothetical protein